MFKRYQRRLLLCVLGTVFLGVASAQDKISDAETRLFLTEHLKNVSVKTALEYKFERTGSLERNFEDKVVVGITPSPKGKAVHVEFLSGQNRFNMQDVEGATGNPVLLSFLEREIKEMNRLTKGPVNYFRQTIRKALASGAEVKPVAFKLNGKDLSGWQIMVAPYENDQARARFERFSNKAYVFTLSEQVPGGVYQLRSIMKERSDQAKAADTAVSPMLVDTLTFAGIQK